MSTQLLSRQHAATSDRVHQESAGAAAPGKRSLVEQIQLSAIQMHGGGAQSTDAVHAAAARGIETPTSALPHGDTIQRAFGRHDISSVKAHTGGDAAHSARSMGADAYAAGDHVVLGRSDLHTVAHEAAHVVQQRGGVQLKGGVGQAGDAYEQHADAVADKVVAGESAETLLSAMAGPGGAAGAVQQLAVQRNAEAHAHEADHDGELDEGEGETEHDEHQATHAAPVQKTAAGLGNVFLKRSSHGKRGYRQAPSLAAVRAGSASIRRGMKGESVKFVQQHVGADVDGLFGPQTQAAVKGFQGSHHLEVDGIVGTHTIGAIDHRGAGGQAHKGGGAHHSGGGGAGGGGGSAHDGGGGHPSGSEAAVRDEVIAKARSHMGARYSWAAEGPSMFDCSGFAWYVLHTDMHLTSAGRTTAAGLSHAPYTTHTAHPEKGDLVFYSSGGISHVTIALGQGSEVIGASGGGQHTHGQDPNARVKETSWAHDSRSKSFGSIQGLINRRLGK